MANIIGYAPGVFDLFHIGHLRLLRHARAHCDHLVVGLLTDEATADLKGTAPLVPLHERLDIIRALNPVDDVFVISTPNTLEAWQNIGFHRLFKGVNQAAAPSSSGPPQRRTTATDFEVYHLSYTPHIASASASLRYIVNVLAAVRA
ncbi:MAG: adenylyltransferase/cytidyltransferase family protein [Actinomycetes bacterium]